MTIIESVFTQVQQCDKLDIQRARLTLSEPFPSQ